MKTQEEIKQDIVNQLAWDSRVDANNITVRVQDNKATLSGTVSSYLASNAAREIASTVRGIQEVENLITVEFPSTFVAPSDEQIKDNVKQMLRWNYDVDESDIDINVADGHVTLEGTVESFWQKISAESDAERATGVIDVTSKMAVVPTEKISDKMLGERILDRIESNTIADLDAIDVEVEDGEVTLTGSVPSWYVWNSVYDAVQYTTGVTDILDNLEIEYEMT